MSLARTLAAVVVALAIALVLVWRSGERAAPASAEGEALTSTPSGIARFAPPAARAVPVTASPSLPDAPFRAEDFAVTTDMPEGPLVVLRSSMRVDRELTVELAPRARLPEGKRVFAIVSVSDGLGNTLLDCTWRDVELTGDARKLDCELPLGVDLPLAISAHQLSAPSFVENPTVVAVDKEVH